MPDSSKPPLPTAQSTTPADSNNSKSETARPVGFWETLKSYLDAHGGVLAGCVAGVVVVCKFLNFSASTRDILNEKIKNSSVVDVRTNILGNEIGVKLTDGKSENRDDE